MNVLTGSVARILYGLPFGIFGLLHFMNPNALVGFVPIPGGVFWVYLVGLALLAASVSIIIEKYTRLACILLGIMLLIFALSIYLPGVIGAESEQAMQTSMFNLLKDTALAGGAWVLAGKYESDSGGMETKPGLE